MKRILRLAILAGTVACIFSLFGCRGKRIRDRHILDGPGMINDLNWKAFTLSRSDSYAQYNFSITVESGDFGHTLTGECRDEEGNEYSIEDGVELSGADIQYLRSLNLGNLPDVLPSSENEEDDLILLDGSTVTLLVTYLDGTVQEKGMGSDVSIQLYQRFLPYFINH